MNRDFEALARAWQEQAFERPGGKLSEESLPDWMARLRTFEDRQLRINLAKTFAVIAVMAVLVWVMVTRSLPTVLTQIGLAVVVVSAVVFMAVYWKMQFKVGALNLMAPAADLIGEAIERLSGQKRLFKLYFPVFALFLTLGMNLVLFDTADSPATVQRLLYHLKITGPIFLAFLLAQRIRRLRFRKEIQPVIDHLSSVAGDLCKNGTRSANEAVG